MKPRHPPDDPFRATEPGPSAELQAAEWLIRLQDSDPDPEEPYPDPLERHAAFMDWLQGSPANLPAFKEVLRVDARAQHVDQRHRIDIQALLEKHAAQIAASAAGNVVIPTRQSAPARSRKVVAGAALAAAVLTILGVRYAFFGAENYQTDIGEQLTQKLTDGSVILLNTDTRVTVDFSQQARAVRLVRGEAFFTVERDSDRPFTVHAGGTAVDALGTEFDVRRKAKSTDVAVVEGKVRVSAVATESRRAAESAAAPKPSPTTTPPASGSGNATQGKSDVTVIGAGESAQVVDGTVTKGTGNVADALAWRQKQLVFRDKPLADIAAEFNRYNRSQIRVEGDAARAMRITGVFDSRDLQRVLLIARNHEALVVEAQGKNWVIRSR